MSHSCLCRPAWEPELAAHLLAGVAVHAGRAVQGVGDGTEGLADAEAGQDAEDVIAHTCACTRPSVPKQRPMLQSRAVRVWIPGCIHPVIDQWQRRWTRAHDD